MRKNFRNYLVKVFSLVLAFILVFPAELFAMAMDDTKGGKYTAATSVMGLAENQEGEEVLDDTANQGLIKSETSTDETEDYIIEKSANLSKTTGQIDYKIVVKAKTEDTKADQNLLATFGINKNTDLKDLKVEKLTALHTDKTESEIKYQAQEPGILYTNDAYNTLGIKAAKAENAMVYYLTTNLSEEALKNIEEQSPIMALDINIADTGANVYQNRYALELVNADSHDLVIDEKGDVTNPSQSLKEVEENAHLYKGVYKESSSSLLGKNPAEIVWTDFINPKDDKEFTFDISLDDSQDTSKSEIKIEFYEATEKGFVIKDEFTKTLAYANSLKLQVPNGHIAKVEFATSVKKNTNPKTFSLNNKEIKNPIYKEETSQTDKKSSEETNTDKEEDPLPADSSKEEKATSKLAKEQAPEKVDQADNSNETSAITLNKEAYLAKAKKEDKLTSQTQKATNQIAFVLESYNKEEINWDEFKSSVKTIAEAQKLDSNQTEEILSALVSGLAEDKYKVANIDIEDATSFEKTDESNNENAPATEEGAELSVDEIKTLIKEEFAKETSGQITEEELEQTLAKIREENNIDKETFFNILEDLYQNGEIANDREENTTTVNTDKTKEETLAEKLSEENLSTEDFIAFLKSYVKAYDIKEDELESILKENQVEVEKLIGDFTIDEIVAAAYLDELNPHIFAGTNIAILDADFSNEKFITELEYSAETLTRATNEYKFFEIVRSNSTDDLSDQEIRNDYVGWKINIPGTDDSGNDITEFKKEKYEYDNLNFSIYAPAGQSLEDYKVVVEDENTGSIIKQGELNQVQGSHHYIYDFNIAKNQLSENGYNIYVVAKAPKKRQNYAIGLKVSPNKNYVTELAENYKDKFEELKEKYPLLIKWMDTSDANPYRNGINLIDTRMVYLEPKGWQDLFPYNGFRSLDYNDNVTDTDNIKNTVSMFGNIDKNGQITWTISETFPAEDLVNKNTVGIDAYSAKTDGQGLTGPSVQIQVPDDNGGYDVTDLGNVAKETLQEKIGNKPGTIVNYTFTDKATNKEEFTTLSLDSGKSASIAHKPALERKSKDIVDQTGLKYLHKVQEHKDGPGYEIALANDQANTMKAFIPRKPSADPRYNDPDFTRTGVIVFCLNPGKPEPTRQYKFNGTITKGEWSTAKADWAKNGKALAALATANEAKSSPLYKGTTDNKFYESLYEHLLRMYWYGQEIAEEYQLDEQSYYKIIQYNLYYWLAGENYAESFRNMGGYNPNYFSSAEYSYAKGLKNRIEQRKDWDKVNYDEEIQFFYYGHDKTRSYQNTITGDTKRKAKKGSVTVNKIDQEGKKLAGAYFQLLDANKNPIKTLVTDANGVAIFDDLDYGTYYIKEVQGPKGYQFSDQQTKIEVGEEKAHVTFNHTNTKNEIKFRKVNENGYDMAGVVFELRLNGRALSGQEQTSDEDGKFSWKELTPGNYQVVEKDISKYPKYSENEGRTVASFRVDENNIIQDKEIYYPNGKSKIDIKNEKNEGKPIGIEFTKVDLKTENPLEGAEFVLEYRKPDSSIFRELPGSRTSSNSQGKLIWNELVDGDYRVIETKAPGEEYETDINLGEKATFTIVKNQNGYYEIKDKDQLDLKITNIEKPEEPKDVFGEFEFTKVDSETKDKLQGVEFTLTSDAPVGPANDKFDYKVSKTTDAEGKINYTNLYPGTYTLTETKQLPGYKENTETWKVVVAEDGTTKVYDEARNELTKKALNLTFLNNNNKVVTNKADYTFSLSKTDEDNIVDLNLTIEPQKTTNKATIYYVYDDDKNAKLLDELARSGTVAKIVPIKVNDKDEYKGHIQKAYLSNGLKNNPNGILVSYITNDYANQLTSEEIDLMVKGKQIDVDSTNKPLFAYYKITSKNLSKIYNTGAGSHGFYKAGFEDNPDFKELIDFINSGAINSTDKIINIQLSYDQAISPVEGQKYFNINPFFHNGKYLIPGKPTTITKVKVDPEQIKNNYNSEANVFDEIRIRSFDRNETLEYGANLPRIKVDESSDSSPGSGSGTTTLPGTGSSQGFTISNEKKKPETANLTIRKYDKDTNLGLEGAEFELYDNASATGKPIDKATSNEHGYATFNSENIQLDTTYYVKEVKAPEGYKFTSAITKVTSSAQSDNTINAEIPNEKNNSRFELYKKDSNGNYLEGAKFRLLDENQNKFEPDRIETTDSNGYIKFDNLKAGKTYYLEEVEAPDGYRKKEGKLKLIVDKDGYISWKNESLVEEADSAEPSKIITNDVLKVEKNAKSESYNYEFANNPNYMNARDYVEATDPENSLITYYLMLKPRQEDITSATNKPTLLELNATNANLEKVELFDVNPGRDSKQISGVNEKIYIGDLMNSRSIDDRVIYFLDRTQAKNSDAGNITMGSSTISEETTNIIENNQASNAFIKFPHNGSEGRFDGNWSYIVKVTARIDDKYKESQIGYNWKTIDTPNNNDAILHHFDLPALYEKEVITKENEDKNTEAPSFTVINQKKPSINFVKADEVTGKRLAGAQFVLYKDDGILAGEKVVENSLTSSDADGNFGFDNLEKGSYTVYETVAPQGYPYLEDKIKVATFTVNDGKVTNLTTYQQYDKTTIENFDPNEAYPIYNKINEIKFTKIGKDKKALAGAKFKLDRVWDSYDDKGDLQHNRQTVLENIETLDDGIIALSATEPGRYQLVETYAPKGYQQIKTDNDEEVKIGGQIVAEFTVERGSLDIKNVLVGDKYIQDMTGNTETLEIVNKKEGKGKFQVNKVEKSEDSGHVTYIPLEGAKFLLKDMKSGQYVKEDGSITTSSGDALTDGSTVNYKNLPVGEYELREFKSPDGYVRTINTWTIKVEKGGQTSIKLKDDLDDDVDDEITPETTSSPAILKLVNKSNEIEFEKVDSNTEDPLKDVEFEVWWDQQGNIENRYEDTGDTGDTKESQYKNYVKIKNPDGGTTFTTDADGKFKLSNLKTGHYKIYEVEVPKGYKVTDQPTDNEPIADANGEFVNEFFVDMDGDIKKNDNGIVGGDDDVLVTTIKNTPITGKFRVQKVGEDGVEKLDGAEFNLYKVDENGNAQGESSISKPIEGVTGLVEFVDLEDGQYLLEETKAPTGYVLSTTKWEVTVKDGKVNISSTDGSSYFTRTDDTLTLNVVNKKPTYPSTGGDGTKIAFALIGTAVMITGLLYFGIFQKEKNRKRFSR